LDSRERLLFRVQELHRDAVALLEALGADQQGNSHPVPQHFGARDILRCVFAWAEDALRPRPEVGPPTPDSLAVTARSCRDAAVLIVEFLNAGEDSSVSSAWAPTASGSQAGSMSSAWPPTTTASQDGSTTSAWVHRESRQLCEGLQRLLTGAEPLQRGAHFGKILPELRRALQNLLKLLGEFPAAHPPSAEYSTFDVDRAVEVADVRAPWRRRIDRLAPGPAVSPSLLLITDTAGRTAETAKNHFMHSGNGPHYLVSISGEVVNFVDPELCAWCGNPGFWGTLANSAHVGGIGRVNEVHNFAVSVALEGDGALERDDGAPVGFRDCQYAALAALARELAGRFAIEPWNVVGLAEVCMPPGRFTSPGPHFDWRRLADEGLAYAAAAPRPEDLVGRSPEEAAEERLELARAWGYEGGSLERRLPAFRARHWRGCPPGGAEASWDVAILQTLLRQREAAQARA